jgi:SAM-dependent methyltransferase
MFVRKLRKKIVAVVPPFLVRIIEYMVRQIRSSVGIEDIQWLRVVMDKETATYVGSLNYQSFHALEISGIKWANFGFQSYRSVDFPEYDICQGPLSKGAYDIIIAEQVLEHCLWPYRAVRHLYEMLRSGGVVVVTTPFLVRVHDYPVDCSRWTELGLKHLLAEGKFPLDKIKTGSWGNRKCVVANFKDWQFWRPKKHSLVNEPEFPISVWAFAHKNEDKKQMKTENSETVSQRPTGY